METSVTGLCTACQREKQCEKRRILRLNMARLNLRTLERQANSGGIGGELTYTVHDCQDFIKKGEDSSGSSE